MKQSLNMMFRESKYDKNRLNVDFDNGFSNSSGAEEGPEGDREVATSDASEIKQRIRDLKNNYINNTLAQSKTVIKPCLFKCA